VVGPQTRVAAVDAISTQPTVISSVNGTFFRTVPLATTPLGVVRVAPKEVRVAGEVAAIVERSIGAVPITTAASGFVGFLLKPERVSVCVSGRELMVCTITMDRVRGIEHLAGTGHAGCYTAL